MAIKAIRYRWINPNCRKDPFLKKCVCPNPKRLRTLFLLFLFIDKHRSRRKKGAEFRFFQFCQNFGHMLSIAQSILGEVVKKIFDCSWYVCPTQRHN